MKSFTPTVTRHAAELDALQARFAYRIAARLDERAEQPSHEVAERLRVARERALERARASRASAVPVAAAAGGQVVLQGNGTATLARGGAPSGGGWWLKLAGLLPLAALVGGLMLIHHANVQAQIDAAAEIDSALLSDDLPPDAYSDPGFAEFLKTPNDH